MVQVKGEPDVVACRCPGGAQGRPDRGRRRLPCRLPRWRRLGPRRRSAAAQVGSLLATYVHRDGRHPGVRLQPAAVPRAAREGLRRRRRSRGRAAPRGGAAVGHGSGGSRRCRAGAFRLDRRLACVPTATAGGDARWAMTTSSGSALDLEPQTLLTAYRSGLFPMRLAGRRGPLGWWSPDPRGVLPLTGLKSRRSLASLVPPLRRHRRRRLRRRRRGLRGPPAARWVDRHRHQAFVPGAARARSRAQRRGP